MESPLGGIGRSVNNAARGAFGGVEKLIATVEALAEGIGSIEREMKGMRRDLRETIDQIEGLRADLEGFPLLRDSTVTMSQDVKHLSDQLDGVNMLLDRYPRLTGKKAAERKARREESNGS